MGLNARVKERFARFGWGVTDALSGEVGKGGTFTFARLADAVFWRGALAPSSQDAHVAEAVEVHVAEDKV